jgi:hypothetical protein
LATYLDLVHLVITGRVVPDGPCVVARKQYLFLKPQRERMREALLFKYLRNAVSLINTALEFDIFALNESRFYIWMEL